MSSSVLIERTADFPAWGTAQCSIVQGRHGDRGNLELVAPHPTDGFWVWWFNGDATVHPQSPGATEGHWSGALHIPTGGRLDRVYVVQHDSAPFALDVLGVDLVREGADEAGGMHRWTWTQHRGFVDAGAAPRDEVRRADTADADRDVLARCISTLGEVLEEVITRDLQHQRFRGGSMVQGAPLRSVVRWPPGEPVDREGRPPMRA